MEILINDANILIDLVELDLLDKFVKLSFKLYTTDFVLNEINLVQKQELDKLIRNKDLIIIKTKEAKDYSGIQKLNNTVSGLSFEDCSVWHYSIKMKAVLLTGDGLLRKKARESKIIVRGIIFVFDEFVKQKILDEKQAAKKIKELNKLNTRLPKDEIKLRINKWET